MASGKKSIMLMLKILDLESINAASFKLTDMITIVPATPKLKFTKTTMSETGTPCRLRQLA